MKNSTFIISFTCLLLCACNKEKTATILPPQELKVVEISPQTVPVINEFVGQVYGEKDIPIRARVEGYLEEIHFDQGTKVQKGDLLYVIDSAPFREGVATAQSGVSQAETMLIQKESNLARVEPLAKLDAVSKRELDNAVASRDAAKSSLDAAHANLNIAQINLSYCKIYAPITGVIGKTLAKEGEFVGRDPNPVILNTVSDINTIRVEFFLSEIEYLKVAREYIEQYSGDREQDKKNTKIELILADGSLYKYKGKMNFIDRNINPSTGSILLQTSFPNPDGLIRPGQFARVRVQIREIENALLVPQKCVTELQSQYSVLIVNTENKIETKQIEIGDKFGQFYIVEKGLNAKDKVVLEGLQKVRPGMEVIPVITEFNETQKLNE